MVRALQWRDGEGVKAMKLSTHFTLAEFTVSTTAVRLGIDNTPPAEIRRVLIDTADRMEGARAILCEQAGRDIPIILSSVWRCAALNRAVKGSKNSAHTRGRGVDFTAPAFGTPLQVARALARSSLGFDQLINEFSVWVHLGFDQPMRRQLLTISRGPDGKTRTAPGLNAVK